MGTIEKTFSGECAGDRNPKKYLRLWADKYAKLLKVDRFHERAEVEQSNIIDDLGEMVINALRYYGSPDRSQWDGYEKKLRTHEGREIWETLKSDMDYNLRYYEHQGGADRRRKGAT